MQILKLAVIIMMALPITARAEVGLLSPQDSLASLDATLPRFTEIAALVEGPAPQGYDFAKGTWTGQAFISGTYGFDDGDLYLAHVGVGYHIADALSVNLEFFGGYMFEDELGVNPNTTIGFDLLLRLHLLHGDGWSIFVEGGSGMVWFQDGFPSGGTHQNFTPQGGFGFTAKIFGEARLLAGMRWHHISNANKTGRDRNPGFDGIMAYAGIMFPF